MGKMADKHVVFYNKQLEPMLEITGEYTDDNKFIDIRIIKMAEAVRGLDKGIDDAFTFSKYSWSVTSISHPDIVYNACRHDDNCMGVTIFLQGMNKSRDHNIIKLPAYDWDKFTETLEDWAKNWEGGE